MAVDLGLSLAAFVLIFAVVLFLPGGLFGIGGLIFLVCAVSFGAALPLLERTRALRYGKIPAVLSGLAGLAECNVRGLTLISKVRAPDPSVPPLAMSMFGDDVAVSLEIPWDLPADVLARGPYSYSDLPGLLEEVEVIRVGLTGYEFVRTDLIKGLLTSWVHPVWNRWPKAEESAEALRDRILDRWRHMESMRRRAALERVFAPRLIKSGRPSIGQAELFTGWCPRCWMSRLVRPGDNPDCPKCHARLWLVWSTRGAPSGAPWKMDHVRDRYLTQ